ncbi:hypothetical protein CALVIDRAFT_569495 [Calocera viscosa TUFC12733]|uniref:Uncharacterized protein n=1 Tax=Calocera viscosa (strain TUFC12733) TaxID=1330018 RepID=A0A167FX77_CALVF|nr:hypothetical protein CALVIDRAFT_569495 [Calocera viscosa TUFC12733]
MAAATNDPFWYPKDFAAESERRRARMPTSLNLFAPPPQPAVRYVPSNEALRAVTEAQAQKRLKQAHPAKPAPAPQPTSRLQPPALTAADRIDEFLAQAAMRNNLNKSLSTRGPQPGSSQSDTERRPRRIILEQGNVSISVQSVPSQSTLAPAPAASHSRRSSASSITKPRLEAVPEGSAPEMQSHNDKRNSFDNKLSPPAPLRPALPVRQPGASLPQARVPPSPALSAGSMPSSAGSAHSRQSHSDAHSPPHHAPAPAQPASSTNSRHSDAPTRDRDSTPKAVQVQAQPAQAAHASKPVRTRTLSESAARVPPNSPVNGFGFQAQPGSVLKRDRAPQAVPAGISPPSESRRHVHAHPAPLAPPSAPRNAFGEAVQPQPVSLARPAQLNPANAFAALGPETASRVIRKTRFAGIAEEDGTGVGLRPPHEQPRRSSVGSRPDAAAQFAADQRRMLLDYEARVAEYNNRLADSTARPPGVPTIRRAVVEGPPTRPAQRAPQHAVAAALRRKAPRTLSVASLEVWTGDATEGETSGLESARSSVYQTWGVLPPPVDVQEVINRWRADDDAAARANRGRRTRPGVTFDIPEQELPSTTRLTEERVGRLPDAVRTHNER